MKKLHESRVRPAAGARFAQPLIEHMELMLNNQQLRHETVSAKNQSNRRTALFFQAPRVKVTKFKVTPQQKASLIPEPELSQLDLIRLIQQQENQKQQPRPQPRQQLRTDYRPQPVPEPHSRPLTEKEILALQESDSIDWKLLAVTQ